MDIDELAGAMFEAAEALDGKSPKDVLLQDYKLFDAGDVHFGVGQGSFVSKGSYEQARDMVASYLPEALRQSGLQMIFYMLTSLPEQSSLVLFAGTGTRELLENAFGVQAGPYGITLQGVVSRKKQFIPQLLQGHSGQTDDAKQTIKTCCKAAFQNQINDLPLKSRTPAIWGAFFYTDRLVRMEIIHSSPFYVVPLKQQTANQVDSHAQYHSYRCGQRYGKEHPSCTAGLPPDRQAGGRTGPVEQEKHSGAERHLPVKACQQQRRSQFRSPGIQLERPGHGQHHNGQYNFVGR